MRIVLVRPNYASHVITPPLGLGYLASYLKRKDVKVKIIDGLRDNLTEDSLLEKILSEKPDAVGITCLTTFYKEAISLSKLLKKNNVRCIIGGPHCTFLPYKTLVDSNADFVICGEGEIAFSKLIKNNFVNKNITGVYSKGNLKKDYILIKKAETIQNLDDLPFPDWEQINPNTYPKAPHGIIVKNFPIGTIMTSRGCPYDCTFCVIPHFYNHKMRFRTPENVIQEIKYLVNNFGVKEIHFEDDNLTLKRDRIVKICSLILKNNIKISWACPNGIRADKVDEKLINLMAKSGCYHIAYGIESVNQKILKNIRKKETKEQIEKTIKITDRAGIISQGLFIFGLPGETKKTIEENIKFAKKSKLLRAQFLTLGILPGSQLWYDLQGKFKPNWNKNSYEGPEWVPKNLSKKYLMEAQAKAFKQFYFRPKIFFNIIKSIKLTQVRYLLRYLVKRLFKYKTIRNKK